MAIMNVAAHQKEENKNMGKKEAREKKREATDFED